MRDVAPDAELLLLLYLPTVRGREEALMPIGWARPAFDVLQLEDYEWVTAGNRGASARGTAGATSQLGYPPERVAELERSGAAVGPAEGARGSFMA